MPIRNPKAGDRVVLQGWQGSVETDMTDRPKDNEDWTAAITRVSKYPRMILCEWRRDWDGFQGRSSTTELNKADPKRPVLQKYIEKAQA